MKRDELIKHCADLQLVLTDDDSVDINEIEMADELTVLTTMVQSNLSPIELLKCVINTGDFAPNVCIALRIFLTLPVTVATRQWRTELF